MIEFTPWYQSTQQPLRKGLYLVKASATSGCQHLAFWNGRNWYSADCANKARCPKHTRLGGARSNSNVYHWQGLLKQKRVAKTGSKTFKLYKNWPFE